MCVSPQISQIWGEQEGNFQFLMAQRTLLWRKQSDAPPPLNLLGLPYLMFDWVRGKLCPSTPGRQTGRVAPGADSNRDSKSDLLGSSSERLGSSSERDLEAIEVRVTDYITRAEDAAVVQQEHWRSALVSKMTSRFAHLETRLNTVHGQHEIALSELSSSLGDVHAQLSAISAKLGIEVEAKDGSSSSQTRTTGFKTVPAPDASESAAQPRAFHRSAVMGSGRELTRRPSVVEEGVDGTKQKDKDATAIQSAMRGKFVRRRGKDGSGTTPRGSKAGSEHSERISESSGPNGASQS